MSGLGGGFCFTFAPRIGVASVMDFDIKTTGTFDYSSTNVPDLKINFRNSDGGFDGNGAGAVLGRHSVLQRRLPRHHHARRRRSSRPATWAMMVVRRRHGRRGDADAPEGGDRHGLISLVQREETPPAPGRRRFRLPAMVWIYGAGIR